MFLRRFALLLSLGLDLALSACSPAPERRDEPAYSPDPSPATSASVYVLDVHPLHAQKRLFEVDQPLVDYLNDRLKGASLRLEGSTDYAAFEAKLARRQVPLALPNPWQTVQCLPLGYRVFATMGNDNNFRGVLLVRRDGGIQKPQDLIGKAISYPAPTALAATLMTQWLLHEQGIDVMHRIDNRYVGTQESAIMNVSLGLTAAGSTWISPWRAFQREHPELADKLEAKWQTPSLPNNSLVARGDVPGERVEQLATLLIGLDKAPEGRTILERMELSRFERATNASYQPVMDFNRPLRAGASAGQTRDLSRKRA